MPLYKGSRSGSRKAAKGEPVALMMRILLYMLGYGPREVGRVHPEWGAKVDPNWTIELRGFDMIWIIGLVSTQ